MTLRPIALLLAVMTITNCAPEAIRYEKSTVLKCNLEVEVLSDLKASWRAADFQPACKFSVTGFRLDWQGVMQSKHDPTCGFFYRTAHLVTLDNYELKLNPEDYAKCF